MLAAGAAAADVDVRYDDKTDEGVVSALDDETLSCSYAPQFAVSYLTKGDPAKRAKPTQFTISFVYDDVPSSEVPDRTGITVVATVGKARHRWIAAVGSDRWPNCKNDCDLVVTVAVSSADVHAITKSKTVLRLFRADCELPKSARDTIGTLLREAPAFSKTWKPPAAE
ncbi:MAG TPA: hypothetical protein VL463_12525 [Kofleriaceae bacterium]|nr:hypothetical protein [Kofleriaceae bacterium]